jgi:hypothetical protein
VARFKKKEDVGTMTKSILKHKIQTLTGRNVKTIEEEMDYRPKDPNEPSMDVDTMRRLASSLILLSNGELPAAAREDAGPGRKRAPSPEAAEREAPAAKAPRRSLAVQEPAAASPARRGRRSLAVLPSQPAASPAARPGSRRRSGSGSLAVTSCPGPAAAAREHLAPLEEDSEVSNPTPQMKEMMEKKRSVEKVKAAEGTKSPAKPKLKSRADTILALSQKQVLPLAAAPASPRPREDFPGRRGAKAFLVAGLPLDLRLARISKTLPLSAAFPGAALAVVHTPADWGPAELFTITGHVKRMNKEAGLASFVLLVGTGLQNVHMNLEALGRHSRHTQFVTFHRADAGKGDEAGKLRETCSYFIVAYFFPGCDIEGSVLPSKMVRDGFSTCFVTESTVGLEAAIVDCFSEEGEWLLDLACGGRQLSVAALERGRSSVLSS